MVLPEQLSEAMGLNQKAGPIRALHVFDFDATLVRTPSPEDGKQAYFRATGTPWPRPGWWGHADSLSTHVLPSPLPSSFIVSSVFEEYEDVSLRSQTAACVVLTGRISKLRPAVLRVLHDAALTHCGTSFVKEDAVFTNPGGKATLPFKTALIRELLEFGPDQLRTVRELHIWEDREEHAKHFDTTFADVVFAETGVQTTVHFVPASLK